MPLCCRDDAQNLYSFRFSPTEWAAITATNRKERRLRMPCCESAVILKRSKYGTQFFAHASKGKCASAPESPEHLLAKDYIARAIELAGWTASVEHRGVDNDWVADVLAQDGDRRIAFEVQLSHQAPDETQRRHLRYQANGIGCVWLLKAPKARISATGSNEVFAPLFHLKVADQALVVRTAEDPSLALTEFVFRILRGQQPQEMGGISRAVARHISDQRALQSVAKVKAVIAHAAGVAGWRTQFDAWFPAEDHASTSCLNVGAAHGWSVSVLASQGSSRVAFHVETKDAGLGEMPKRHYAKMNIRQVPMTFNLLLKRVIGDGYNYLRNADELTDFVNSVLSTGR